MPFDSVVSGGELMELMGKDVHNVSGEDLGKLEDFAVEPVQGRIMYGIVRIGGGFLKAGKLFAVPWSSFQFSTSGVMLDVQKSVIDNAPSFDKDNWPDMADRRWGTSIHNYFQAKPYWEEEQKSPTEPPQATTTDPSSASG